jgi:hypothetical protein
MKVIRRGLREAIQVGAAPDISELFVDWYEKFDLQFPWEQTLEMAFTEPWEVSIVTLLRRGYDCSHGESSREEEYFKRAAAMDFLQVMFLLIQQHPQMIHKAWMLKGEIPELLSSTKHQDFLAWLHNMQSQPLSLKLFCREEIRRHLGHKPKSGIDQLPLPNLLKGYLKKEEVL